MTRNITDPESRLMPTRSGFDQAYNAQNVLSEDGLILATDLGQSPNDVTYLQPMMAHAEQAADLVNTEDGARAARPDLPCTCPDQPDTSTRPPRGPRCRRHPDGIATLVTDAGYLSRDNLTAPGPDRLIAVGKHRDLLAAAADPAPTRRVLTASDADGPVVSTGNVVQQRRRQPVQRPPRTPNPLIQPTG